jgi:hypothetical protein
VLAAFELAPIHIELAVHRLKMLAVIAKDKEYHELFIAAMFGEMVNAPSRDVGPHPHLQQMINDFRLLALIDELAEDSEYLVMNPSAIFYNNDINKKFGTVDLSVIKYRYINPAVPRPRI